MVFQDAPLCQCEKAVLLQALFSTDQERNGHGTSRIRLVVLCFPEAWFLEGPLDQRLLMTVGGAWGQSVCLVVKSPSLLSVLVLPLSVREWVIVLETPHFRSYTGFSVYSFCFPHVQLIHRVINLRDRNTYDLKLIPLQVHGCMFALLLRRRTSLVWGDRARGQHADPRPAEATAGQD